MTRPVVLLHEGTTQLDRGSIGWLVGPITVAVLSVLALALWLGAWVVVAAVVAVLAIAAVCVVLEAKFMERDIARAEQLREHGHG